MSQTPHKKLGNVWIPNPNSKSHLFADCLWLTPRPFWVAVCGSFGFFGMLSLTSLFITTGLSWISLKLWNLGALIWVESGVKIETLLQYHHCHIHQYQHHRHYRAIVLILIINLIWVNQKRFGSKHSSFCGRRRCSFCKKTKQFAAIDALRIRSWLWVHSRFKRQARTIFFNKLVGKKRKLSALSEKKCLLEIIKLLVENKILLRRCGDKGGIW